MVNLIGLLTLFKPQQVLVIGDLMLDSYTIGKASRISPEAPVPVLHVQEERSLPGGAGNVALNLLSLGQGARIFGRYGDDHAGHVLKQSLMSEKVDISGLFAQSGYRTPVKNRIIANNQQMIRIDHEQLTPLSGELENRMLAALPELLNGIKIIAISDYGKGFLSRRVLTGLIQEARKRNITVVADPKGADFSKYNGATVLKPNLKEAYAAAHMGEESLLDEVAFKLLSFTQIESLMITRSEAGITIFDKHSRRDFPVRAKEVKDVTGAGDTVLATIAAALASDLTLDQAAELANIAASLAVEHVGCARVTLAEMAERLLDDHVHHKVIDHTHAQALHFALKDRPHTILELEDDTVFSPELYQKIQSLKMTPKHTLVMSLPPQIKNPYLIPILTSIREVDFVLQNAPTKGNL